MKNVAVFTKTTQVWRECINRVTAQSSSRKPESFGLESTQFPCAQAVNSKTISPALSVTGIVGEDTCGDSNAKFTDLFIPSKRMVKLGNFVIFFLIPPPLVGIFSQVLPCSSFEDFPKGRVIKQVAM